MALRILLTVYCVLSAVALVLYGYDKRMAKKHRRRIRESVLLTLGFFGGSIGALAGMFLFRHKTRHASFWFVNGLGLIWQIALVAYLFIR